MSWGLPSHNGSRKTKKPYELIVRLLWWSTSKKVHPLIVEEIARWSDLLWEDYLDYQQEQKRRKKVVVP
jgi:hypothetical protein